MTCDSCKNRINFNLEKVDWIVSVEVIVDKNMVILVYEEELENMEEVIDIISNLGYGTNLERVYESEEDFKNSRKQNLYRIFVTFAFLILLYFAVKRVFGFDFLNTIPSIDSSISLPILFIIGLMTSIHCVGMCGAINLAASVRAKQKHPFKRPLLYNLGRVISYTITGGIAGLIGRVLTPSLWMQGLLVGFASVFMLLMGLSMLGVISKKILHILPKYKKLSKVKTSSPLLMGLLNGLSKEDIVIRLDSITNESPGFKASITGTKLIISEKEESIEYDIPIEKFYLSFAPYITNIHPCVTHSLISCRGELINETFEIKIIDKNNNVIYSGLNTSMSNGFIGLWLPKGIEANLVIKYQELYIETEITTYEDDDTCLTTPLRLE